MKMTQLQVVRGFRVNAVLANAGVPLEESSSGT